MSISGASNQQLGAGLAPELKQNLSEAQEEAFLAPATLYDSTHNYQPLEVYMYWAAIEREREANDTRPIPDSPWTAFLKTVVGRRSQIVFQTNEPPPSVTPPEIQDIVNEKHLADPAAAVESAPGVISAAEREAAYRALRVASWQVVFYLITTDILGFSSAPEAFNELGLGPGILVYVFFYLLAVFAGQVIWKLYLNLDSSKYPVTCYADLGERVFGRVTRHIFNIVQSFQLLFNVALLIVGNSQTLVAIINYKFCYLAINIFFMLLGMCGGQIKSLKNFSWFANCNIWLNILVMILTVIGIYKYPPVPQYSGHTNLNQPVEVSGWVPSYTVGWYQQVSGVQLAVFAYGGAMIFPEFMAEMRRPRDFWKSAACAQFFCFFMYMLFGLVCYIHQGQYSSILPGLDFTNQTYILVNNIIGLVTTMVAAVLYGNIGVKVFYENVLRAYFKAPSLVSTKGRFAWAATVVGYWVVAWVIGMAIPNLIALITLVGAACILQFTYTFPPLLLMGYWMQIDANAGDNPWTPGMEPGSNRVDTWKNGSRWSRGFRKYWYVKVFLFLMFLGAMANCGLGVYAGVESAIAGYKGSYNVPFSCYSPYDPRVLPKSSSG